MNWRKHALFILVSLEPNTVPGNTCSLNIYKMNTQINMVMENFMKEMRQDRNNYHMTPTHKWKNCSIFSTFSKLAMYYFFIQN